MIYTFDRFNLNSATSHFMFIQLSSLLKIFEGMNVSVYGDACNYLWKCSNFCCSPYKYSTMELIVSDNESMKMESIDVVADDTDAFAEELETYFFSHNLFEVVDMNDGCGKEIVIELTNPLDTDLHANNNVQIIIRVVHSSKVHMSHTCAFSDSLVCWDGSCFAIQRRDTRVVEYLEQLTGGITVDPDDAVQMAGLTARVANLAFGEERVVLINTAFLRCSLEVWLRLSELYEHKKNVVKVDADDWTFSIYPKAYKCGKCKVADKEDDVCAVCLGKLCETRPGKRLHVVAKTRCGHSYHLGCIAKWLHVSFAVDEREPSCPLCKRGVVLKGAEMLYNLF